MPSWRIAAVCAALLVLSTLSACRKKTAASTPLPPQPVVVEPQPPPLPPLPVSEPQTQVQLPPPQEIPAGAVPHYPGPLEAEAAREAAVAKTPQTAPPRTPPAQKPPNGAETTTGPAPAPPPQLGQMLSAEQRRQYNEQTDRSLTEARRNLNVAMQRNLNTNQMNIVRRIQGYIDQAMEARRQDIRMASNLADRARLLAEDLVRNLP